MLSQVVANYAKVLISKIAKLFNLPKPLLIPLHHIFYLFPVIPSVHQLLIIPIQSQKTIQPQLHLSRYLHNLSQFVTFTI